MIEIGDEIDGEIGGETCGDSLLCAGICDKSAVKLMADIVTVRLVAESAFGGEQELTKLVTKLVVQ